MNLKKLLLFGLAAAPFGLFAQTNFASNLPIIALETAGQDIPNEPKIAARMRIVDNGPGVLNHPGDPTTGWDGPIGIEVRGASSSWYPQKPYGLETRDGTGADLDTALLGFPAESDFALISNFNDRSCVRNLLAFNLFRDMGHYAPRGKLVEVTLNGNYRGIYLFCEKIKRGKGRLDIAKLKPDDLAGDDVTGGYIFKVDYYSGSDSWQGQFPPPGFPDRPVHFVYYYPKPEDIAPAQKTYLQNFVFEFERALYGPNFKDTTAGWPRFLDRESFVDYLIVQEVTRNIDGFKKSSFFHKDKDSNGGRLHAGPVWDYDWSLKNIDECPIFSNTSGAGFAHQINDCQGDLPAPGWVPRLLEDTAFANRLRCRYLELRGGPLATARLHAWLDSIQTTLDAGAQQRHFNRWQILGVNTSTPEVPPIPTTYALEINKLKNWLRFRLDWLDQHLPGKCGSSPTDTPAVVTGLPRLLPNPAVDKILVENWLPEMFGYAVFDATGRQLVLPRRFPFEGPTVDVSALPGGVYFLQMYREGWRRIGEPLRFSVF